MSGDKASVPFPISGNEEPTSVKGFTAIRLINDTSTIYIQASGMNPTPGYKTFFYIGPELVFPPRLHFANTPPTGISLQIMTPYYTSFALKVPPEGYDLPGFSHKGPLKSVVIYTADGAVTVPITDELPPKEFPAPVPLSGGTGGIPSPFKTPQS